MILVFWGFKQWTLQTMMTHIYVAMNVVRANLLKKVVTFLSGLRQGRNPENWNGFQHLSARRTNLNMNKYPTPHHPTPQQQFKECIKARGCSAEELELPNFVPYGRLVFSFHSDSSLLHWRSLQTQVLYFSHQSWNPEVKPSVVACTHLLQMPSSV